MKSASKEFERSGGRAPTDSGYLPIPAGRATSSRPAPLRSFILGGGAATDAPACHGGYTSASVSPGSPAHFSRGN